VDVGAGELLAAKQLGFDLVIAHHPAGVPDDVARAAVADRIEATKLRGQIMNNDQTPSVARLLGLPFMNIHAPLDEVGRRRMRAQVDATSTSTTASSGASGRKGGGNLIVTGHLAGDSLGFTPFIAALRTRGLEVTTFSGVIEPER